MERVGQTDGYLDGTTADFDGLPYGLTILVAESTLLFEKLVDYVFERWDRKDSGGIINCQTAYLSFNETSTLIRLSAKNQGPGGFLGVTHYGKLCGGKRPHGKLKDLNQEAQDGGYKVVLMMKPLPGDRIPSWADSATRVARM